MQITPIHTGSDGNLYVLKTSNDRKFLIECGLTEKKTTTALWDMGLSISDFEGCFISHLHSDHSKSIDWVAKYMPIFTNISTKRKFENVQNIFVLPCAKKYTIKDLSVIPFSLEHGKIENYGYMFRDEEDTMLFMTDFSVCYSNIFHNIFNEIFIECNWNKELIKDFTDEEKENRQINVHCGCDITKLCLQKFNLEKCRKITLIHASSGYCDKELSLKQLREAIPNKDIDFAKNLI